MNECMETVKHRAQLNVNRISLFPDFVLNTVTVACNVCVDCYSKKSTEKPDRSLVGRDY